MPAHRDTLAGHVARQLRKRADTVAPITTKADVLRSFPTDPVGFTAEVFGIKLWSRQAEIIAAAVQYKRVSVSSGHKCGKSIALALLALWFYCSFPGARVVITAVTDRQVNGIIWREVRKLVRLARRRGYEIPGGRDIHKIASSGLVNPDDLSEVKGYTAREPEAVAGTSGEYILYLVDEASAVDETIYEAIEGNRAGGNAWLFLISNPTRAEGTFYETHHSRKEHWHTIHIDSRESPNVTGEWRKLWPKPLAGLASPEWIEEKAAEWGEDSAQFKIRVAGEFCAAEELKVFPIALIAQMQARWRKGTAADGRLFVGLDPAGDGDGGDESAAVPRRGKRVLDVRLRSGLNDTEHLAWVIDLLNEFRIPDDKKSALRPVVVVDILGEVGHRVYLLLRDYCDRHPDHFVLCPVRSSDRAVRQPLIFDRIRDELWASAREWGRTGGAVPPHSKLQADLHAPEFFTATNGRLKATPKPKLRLALGRSPDAGDALTLACWEPLSLRIHEVESMRIDAPPRASVYDDTAHRSSTGGLDPYAGGDVWRR